MNKAFKVFLSIFLVLVVIVVVSNYYMLNGKQKIEYIYAQVETVYDNIEASGMFVRTEHIIENTSNDYVHITVRNGERVGKNHSVAILYSDQSYVEQSESLDILLNEQSVLNTVTNGSQSSTEVTKTSILINNMISNFNGNLNPDNLTSTEDIVSNIQTMSIRSAYSLMPQSEITVKKQQISDSINSRRNVLSENMTTIKSTVSGNFINGVDGYENIEEVNSDIILNAIENNAHIKQNQNIIGKIVPNYKWDFLVVVDLEYVQKFENNSNIKVVFESIPDRFIDVSVKKIDIEEEKAVITISGDYTNEEILSMRTSNVDIIFKTYSGIKIPKSATRIVGDKLGIYTHSGFQATFKEIKPIFDKEDYYIINTSKNATSADIIVGDKIVTKSIQLSDQKVMK